MADFKPVKAKCTNCDKPYIKTRVDHRFCDDPCRKQFNKYGISAAKIKYMIEEQLNERIPQLRSALAKQFADILRKRRQEIPAELQQLADA